MTPTRSSIYERIITNYPESESLKFYTPLGLKIICLLSSHSNKQAKWVFPCGNSYPKTIILQKSLSDISPCLFLTLSLNGNVRPHLTQATAFLSIYWNLIRDKKWRICTPSDKPRVQWTSILIKQKSKELTWRSPIYSWVGTTTNPYTEVLKSSTTRKGTCEMRSGCRQCQSSLTQYGDMSVAY